jgi:hypothetical protein
MTGQYFYQWSKFLSFIDCTMTSQKHLKTNNKRICTIISIYLQTKINVFFFV